MAGSWMRGLKISVNGAPVTPHLDHAEAHVTQGSGGLPVLRWSCACRSRRGAGPSSMRIRTTPAGRVGVKSSSLSIPAVRLDASTHGAQDYSRALTSYPQERTGNPPRDVRARFRWSSGAALRGETAVLPKDGGAPAESGPAALSPAKQSGHRDYLSRLLGGGEVTPLMLAAGLCVAFGLGAMHALSPGHGKTIVAAYLVGSRGTMRHAILLGGLVTFTHTISVFALGIGVLLFESYIVPDQVIPVLGAISGLSIVAIGALLLYRRTRALHHDHQHLHGHAHHHAHHHHDHHHDHHHHDGHHHNTVTFRRVRLRWVG
jgi:nickel/cobalt transporter (NicO) family protein